ncbi:MAG: DUF5060 domain-containing protein [Bacteroidota bacterium]
MIRNFLRVVFLFGVFSCSENKEEPPLDSYGQWHTVTLSFIGPQTSELASVNPFLDYRLEVEFKNDSAQYSVRGFYAADGDAAETGADSGNVWQVRFSPDKLGKWSYSAKMVQGDSIAIKDREAGISVELANAHGAFEVVPSDKTLPDFRASGRLGISEGYFQFQDSGRYWIKGGADSPENLLAYEDFDGTYRIQPAQREGEAKTNDTLHAYGPHIRDWNEGDPIWRNGKGKGLIGALNYLASKGMNVVYFLTNNINGDGKDVWPYISPDDFTRFDVSKLDQWEIVFRHMHAKGILLHMVLQETENETLLDEGNTGPMRKLYLQEMVARFGHHLGLKFNLGEENGPADFTPIAQSDAQRKAMTSFLTNIDPYDHPILLHTHSHEPARANVLDSILGFSPLDGLSLQVDKREEAAGVVAEWKLKSKEAGHKWLITMDEIGMWHTGARSDSLDGNHDSLRRFVLWGTLLSGAAGVEWYFGANNRYHDLNTEDWRSRDRLWEITKHAMDFFEEHLPYWEMLPEHDLVNSKEAYCFQKSGEVYAIYLPDSKRYSIDLSEVQGDFNVHWYDPLEGGPFQRGSITTLKGVENTALGIPPKKGQDWVVLLKRKK